MSRKLIIEVADDIDDVHAVWSVLAVVRQGRISEHTHGPHYCWYSVLADGTAVTVNRKRTPESADSFRVGTDPHKEFRQTQE